jgi:PAS domain-containing protein
MTAPGKPPASRSRQIRARDQSDAAVMEVRREESLLKTGALPSAILNSANFSSIATDEKGVIQLFNVGAERMLGYTAAEVVDQITPADISGRGRKASTRPPPGRRQRTTGERGVARAQGRVKVLGQRGPHGH